MVGLDGMASILLVVNQNLCSYVFVTFVFVTFVFVTFVFLNFCIFVFVSLYFLFNWWWAWMGWPR